MNYSITPGENYFEVGLADPDPLLEFPAIYGNIDFSFTVTLFSNSGDVLRYLGVTVTSQPNYVVTSAVSNNSILVSNPGSTLFEGENYTFVAYPDDTFDSQSFLTVRLDEYDSFTDEQKSEYTLTSWNTPSVQEITGSFTFELEYEDIYGSVVTETGTFTQDYFWDGRIGIPIFLNILDETSNTVSSNTYPDSELFGTNTVYTGVNTAVLDANTVADTLIQIEGANS